MNFTKWHGQGNDFIFIDNMNDTVKSIDFSLLAPKLCHRQFGIGADGIVIISKSTCADFKMTIFNVDGSEAEMCGNATRCVAKFVYDYNYTNKTLISLETLAGIIKPELIINNNEITTVKVDMGIPTTKSKSIPININQVEAVNVIIPIKDKNFIATCVSMGNPHCVIFVDDINDIDLSYWGPKIETHPMFPRKTNVEFAQIISANEIRMRVWERGVGITLACGTGACATLCAAVVNNKTQNFATLKLDGGDIYIEWLNKEHIFMSGPAVMSYEGIIKLS